VWRGRGARHLVRLAKKNFGNDRWGEQRTLGFALVFGEIFSFYAGWRATAKIYYIESY